MPPRSYPSPLRFAPVSPPARRSTLPRYVFGPKPKRRTELGLLVFGSLLIVALYVIAALGEKSKIPDNIGPFLGDHPRLSPWSPTWPTAGWSPMPTR